MSLYAPVASRQELDGNGRPYAGGLIYTYESGTTTPKTTYDGDGNANSNPIVLDSEGRYTMRIDNGSYSMTMTDGVGASVFDPAVIEGVVVWTKNGIGYQDAIGTFTKVTTMAEFKGLPANVASFVLVEGFNEAGDEGGGIFYWDSYNTSSDDGGVIIAPNGWIGLGRWHRDFSGNISPRWFGAKADGSDDSPAFVNALAYCTNNSCALELGHGEYTLASDPGFIPSIVIIMGDAMLSWSGFAPTINPLIPVSDTNRHFNSSTFPIFADDTNGKYAEIKNVWLDDVTPGWYQSSIMNDTSAQLTAVDASIRADTSAQILTVTNEVSLTNQLVCDYIRGLDTTRDSTSKITMGPGMTNTTDNTSYYHTIANSTIQKDLSALWAPGSAGGRPKLVSLSDYTWYHMFLLGKTTDTTSFDMGFDISINAANLLADATSFDTYKRIGSIMTESSAVIKTYKQFGNNFFFSSPVQLNMETSSSSVTQTVRLGPPGATTPSCPPNVRTRLNLSAFFQTRSGSTGRCNLGEVGLTDQVFGVHNGGAGGDGQTYLGQVFVWSDTSQQIMLTYGVTGGGTNSMFLKVAGWEDPRGTL